MTKIFDYLWLILSNWKYKLGLNRTYEVRPIWATCLRTLTLKKWFFTCSIRIPIFSFFLCVEWTRNQSLHVFDTIYVMRFEPTTFWSWIKFAIHMKRLSPDNPNFKGWLKMMKCFFLNYIWSKNINLTFLLKSFARPRIPNSILWRHPTNGEGRGQSNRKILGLTIITKTSCTNNKTV